MLYNTNDILETTRMITEITWTSEPLRWASACATAPTLM